MKKIYLLFAMFANSVNIELGAYFAGYYMEDKGEKLFIPHYDRRLVLCATKEINEEFQAKLPKGTRLYQCFEIESLLNFVEEKDIQHSAVQEPLEFDSARFFNQYFMYVNLIYQAKLCMMFCSEIYKIVFPLVENDELFEENIANYKEVAQQMLDLEVFSFCKLNEFNNELNKIDEFVKDTIKQTKRDAFTESLQNCLTEIVKYFEFVKNDISFVSRLLQTYPAECESAIYKHSKIVIEMFEGIIIFLKKEFCLVDNVEMLMLSKRIERYCETIEQCNTRAEANALIVAKLTQKLENLENPSYETFTKSLSQELMCAFASCTNEDLVREFYRNVTARGTLSNTDELQNQMSNILEAHGKETKKSFNSTLAAFTKLLKENYNERQE